MILTQDTVRVLAKLAAVAGELLNPGSGLSTTQFPKPTVEVHYDEATHFTAYWGDDGQVEIDARSSL